MKKGNLFVICGPSGIGKSIICKKLLEKYPGWFLVSVTTRKIRENETDGIDYYFVSKDEFLDKIKNNEFLEYTIYDKEYYGTLKGDIETRLDCGIDVFCIYDVKGARNIKRIYPNAVLIYIKPKEFSDLEKRLINRGENSNSISDRLEIAQKEINDIDDFDYKVINDKLEDTINLIYEIVKTKKSID